MYVGYAYVYYVDYCPAEDLEKYTYYVDMNLK